MSALSSSRPASSNSGRSPDGGPSAARAKGAAGKARNSRTLAVLTRAGLACYGVVHLLVAWLALQIAVGHSTEEGDQSGAFQLLAKQPGGKILLVVVVLGLTAMVVWQLLLALVGYADEQGSKKVLQRLGSAARAVVYGFLAVSAGKVAFGHASSSAGKQQNATAGVLGHSGGRFLVIVAALVVLGLGIGLAVYGALRKFEEKLNSGQMSAGMKRAAKVLGLVGYVTKGVAYAIVGILLFVAAVKYDPDKARGLDSALHSVAGKPYGPVLLGLIALGFAAFGVYCFVQAKYRKV